MTSETAVATSGVTNNITRINGYQPGGTSFATMFYINQSSGSYIWTAVDSFCTNNSSRQLVFEMGQPANYLITRPAVGGAIGASGGGTKSNMVPDDLVGWATAVTAYVNRVKVTNGRTGCIWELWNEFDSLGYFADLVPYLGPYAKATAQAIKAVDPTAIILAPSIYSSDNYPQLVRFLQCSDGGTGRAVDWVDGLAYHNYENYALDSTDGQFDPMQVVNHWLNMQKVQSILGITKPVYITESGYTAAESRQVLDIQRNMLITAALGAKAYIGFAYDDPQFTLSGIATQWNAVAALLAGGVTISELYINDGNSITVRINGTYYTY